MDLGLKDRVAAVAAASQGLGFASALALAREGVRLGICSRSEDNLRMAADRITQDTGAEVFTVVADLSTGDGARGFVDAVAAHYDGLDVLVTNAGGPPSGYFADVGEPELERGFHLTMMSTIEMIRAAVPRMQAQKWGRVVNILSITVKQPEINLLVSNTMRAGLASDAG